MGNEEELQNAAEYTEELKYTLMMMKQENDELGSALNFLLKGGDPAIIKKELSLSADK